MQAHRVLQTRDRRGKKYEAIRGRDTLQATLRINEKREMNGKLLIKNSPASLTYLRSCNNSYVVEYFPPLKQYFVVDDVYFKTLILFLECCVLERPGVIQSTTSPLTH
jgi:hypothetical protein